MRDANEALRTIAAELQATSPTLDEDTRVPYSYTGVTTSAIYQQRMGLILVHRSTGIAWSAKALVEAQKTFKFARGRNPADNSSAASGYPDSEDAVDKWLAETRTLSYHEFRALMWEPIQGNIFKGLPAQNLAKVASRYFVEAPLDQRTSAPSAHKLDLRFRSVVVVKSRLGLGAGFFVSAHNLITNAHVVGADRSVTVRLYGTDEEMPADVIATDNRRDLALLRTSATGVAVSLLAADADTPVGSRLIIIGHPRGLEFSLTSGVVSAIRVERDDKGGVEVIQTDTAMNPGNSGGPVFLGDKVVGVASFKWRSSEGLGFAIHSREVRKFLATAFLE